MAVVSGALVFGDWSCRMDGYRGKQVSAQELSETRWMEGSNGDLSMYSGEWRGLSMHRGESRNLDPVCIKRKWRQSEGAWRENRGELKVHRGSGRDLTVEPIGTEHPQKGWVGSECQWRAIVGI